LIDDQLVVTEVAVGVHAGPEPRGDRVHGREFAGIVGPHPALLVFDAEGGVIVFAKRLGS